MAFSNASDARFAITTGQEEVLHIVLILQISLVYYLFIK